MFSALFTAVLSARPLLAARVPFLRALDAKTQAAAFAWLSAWLHHAAVCAFAVAYLWREFWGEPSFSAEAIAAFVPLSLAYVVTDFFATCLPELREGKYEMTFHHMLGLVLAIASMFAPPFVMRFAPHMWICEASQFGLGLSWFAIKAGHKGGLLQKSAELYFVVSYTFTRVICLPLVVYAISVPRWPEFRAALGETLALVCLGTLWLVVALQLFW